MHLLLRLKTLPSVMPLWFSIAWCKLTIVIVRITLTMGCIEEKKCIYSPKGLRTGNQEPRSRLLKINRPLTTNFYFLLYIYRDINEMPFLSTLFRSIASNTKYVIDTLKLQHFSKLKIVNDKKKHFAPSIFWKRQKGFFFCVFAYNDFSNFCSFLFSVIQCSLQVKIPRQNWIQDASKHWTLNTLKI